MSSHSLGDGTHLDEGKLDLEARHRVQAEAGRAPAFEDLYVSKAAKFVFGLLRHLGLAYPHQFVTPPPWATIFKREGVIQVPPCSYYDLTFPAPRKGYKVLECEAWPMCPLACEQLQIEHYFGESKNSPGTGWGLWKFGRVYLSNNRAYTMRLINPNCYAHLVVGFEFYGWEL
jgi:hypothetical protein